LLYIVLHCHIGLDLIVLKEGFVLLDNLFAEGFPALLEDVVAFGFLLLREAAILDAP
jgi:hypothetical protein